jgi:DNA polymerase I
MAGLRTVIASKRTLIVDGKNALFIFGSPIKYLTTSTGRGSGFIYGFLKGLQTIVEQFPTDEIIVVWEGGRLQKRQELLNTYKGNRERQNDDDYRLFIDDFSTQKRALAEGLNCLGIKQIQVDGLEADDVIGVLTGFSKFDKLRSWGEIIVISNDRDFLQVVDENVFVYSPTRHFLVTPKTFESFTEGINRDRYLAFRVLTGDKSDNIPGVQKGIGRARASDLLNTYDNLDNMVARKGEIKELKEGWDEIALRNWKLMKLSCLLDEEQIRRTIDTYRSLKTNIDIPKFTKFLIDWELVQIRGRMPHWAVPFTGAMYVNTSTERA